MAKHDDTVALSKPLYSDAGSGIIFNFSGELIIGGKRIGEGVILLPVNTKTEHITLSPGAKLAGVRFLPAIGYGVLGRKYDKPTLLEHNEDDPFSLNELLNRLKPLPSINLLEKLEYWVENQLDFTNILPASLANALDFIQGEEELAQLATVTNLSQRQVERIFKLWLGITPKHYQRILRVKNAIAFLKSKPTRNLALVAQEFGFSDQAHMTREFRAIASVTPSKI